MADINVKVYFSATTALSGTIERLSVQPHVELRCMNKQLFLVCDKGYIKSSDSVIFFRYIRSSSRYKKHRIRRTIIGWKEPQGNTDHDAVILVLSSIPTSLVFKGFKDKDLWGVGRMVKSTGIGGLAVDKFEDIITTFKALEKIENVDDNKKYYLFNKKCGIRIKRDGEWITDYLPFMARKIKNKYGIGRWQK